MTINNEQLKREMDILKTDITQLKTDNDAMKDESKQLKANNDKQKDEIGQLTTLLDQMVVNNENQSQQINYQSSEIKRMEDECKLLKTENQQLKVCFTHSSVGFIICSIKLFVHKRFGN